jgi:hypothetical protein
VFVEGRDNMLTTESTNFVFHAKMVNSGKTIAIVTGNICGACNNTNEIPKYDPIASGQSEVLIPNAMSPEFVIPIPRWLFAKEVYFFGTVYYDDIFGDRHWTQFCYCFSDAGKTVALTPFHNACDDSETEQKK